MATALMQREKAPPPPYEYCVGPVSGGNAPVAGERGCWRKMVRRVGNVLGGNGAISKMCS